MASAPHNNQHTHPVLVVLWARFFLIVSSYIVMGIGAIALILWLIHRIVIMQVQPDFPIMVFNTALSFFLLGLSALLMIKKKNLLSLLCSASLILIALLTLLEYFFGMNLGIDELFYTYNAHYKMVFPGRMAPNTAACFLLSGFCLILSLCSYRYLTNLVIEILAGTSIALSSVSMLGYATGFSALIGWPGFLGMATFTAVGLLLLSLSLFIYHMALSFKRPQLSIGPMTGMFVFSLITTALLWQSFYTQQFTAVQVLADHHGQYIEQAIQQTIKSTSGYTLGLVRQWSILDQYGHDLFEKETLEYMSEIPSLSSVCYYNENLALTYETTKEGTVFSNTEKTSLLQYLKNLNQNAMIPQTAFVNIENALFIIHPIYTTKNQFLGSIAAKIDLAMLVQDNTPAFLRHFFNIEVYHEDKLFCIISPQSASSLYKSVVIPVSPLLPEWTLHIIPNKESLTLVQTFTPTFILITGSFMTLFLVLIVFLTQTSIRARKKISIALEERADALANRQALLDSSNYSIISTDLSGIIQSFNPAAEKLLQYKAEELVGKQTPAIFLDPQELETYAKELSEKLKIPIKPDIFACVVMTNRGVVEEREWTHFRKDGSRIPVKLSISAVKNSKGDIIGYVGFLYDLTELKALDQMKNELIAITSHELRSPLSAIKGSLDLLSTGKYGVSEDAMELLTIANHSVARLLKLTSDILDIQKMESGKVEFAFDKISVTDLLNKAFETNQTLSKEIILDKPPTVPDWSLYGDMDRLLQVLTNFISNAIKFSPKQGHVSFVVTSHNQIVRIGVKDQGPGIPEEFRNRIFQKFSQVPSAVYPSRTGSGLGLSICKTIIDIHHGKIGFDSSPQGCLFWFELSLIE